MKRLVGTLASIAAMLLHAHGAYASVPCESLSSMTLPNTTITLAQTVPAGGLTLPAGAPNAGPPVRGLSELPAFCRVAATLKPSVDSDIKIEVWMPVTQWNGKF